MWNSCRPLRTTTSKLPPRSLPAVQCSWQSALPKRLSAIQRRCVRFPGSHWTTAAAEMRERQPQRCDAQVLALGRGWADDAKWRRAQLHVENAHGIAMSNMPPIGSNSCLLTEPQAEAACLAAPRSERTCPPGASRMNLLTAHPNNTTAWRWGA